MIKKSCINLYKNDPWRLFLIRHRFCWVSAERRLGWGERRIVEMIKRNQSWLLVGKRPHCFVALTSCFFLLPAAIFVFIFIFTSHSFLTSACFPICFTFIQLIFCFPEQVFSSAFITFSIVSILYLIFLHHFLFSKYLRPLFLYYTVQFCPKVRFHVHSTSCLCLFFFLSYSLSPLWSCSLHPHSLVSVSPPLISSALFIHLFSSDCINFICTPFFFIRHNPEFLPFISSLISLTSSFFQTHH